MIENAYIVQAGRNELITIVKRALVRETVAVITPLVVQSARQKDFTDAKLDSSRCEWFTPLDLLRKRLPSRDRLVIVDELYEQPWGHSTVWQIIYGLSNRVWIRCCLPSTAKDAVTLKSHGIKLVCLE